MTWCVKILTFLGCTLMTYFFGYSVLREEAIAYFFFLSFLSVWPTNHYTGGISAARAVVYLEPEAY